MKLFSFIFAAFLGSASAWASPIIKLDMKMKIDGGLQASPKILVESGKPATISETSKDGTGYEINAIPSIVKTAGKKDAIMISFKVFTIANGTKNLIASPRVITNEGIAAAISDTGKHNLELSVIPTVTNAASL